MKRSNLDVLAIGELNVDLILNGIDGLPEIGKEKLAKNMALTLGSSTAIFAANVSSLGLKVGFLGKIGKDSFGKLVLDSLKEKEIDVSMVIEDENCATGATVVLNYDEDRANVTHLGAMEFLSIKDISDEQLAQAKHIHFSSLFLQPGIRDDISTLFARAKQLGVTTSLDTQWDPDEKWDFDYRSILPNVDVFLPNEIELLNLSGTSCIEDAFKKLNPFARNIVVKCGSKGAVLHEKDCPARKFSSYLNTSVVDAIGAGDSFNAGFVYSFVKGENIVDCVDLGLLTGALNTTSAGGTGAFATKEKIRKIAMEKFNKKINL